MQLSPQDEVRIRAAAVDVQKRTCSRFALVVVPASDRYALYPLVYGTILALTVGAILAMLWPGLGLRTGFAITAGTAVVASLLFDWWPLRLILVPKHIKQAHARALAYREFAAQVLSSREHDNGMLFFVSLGERCVEIIADSDLHKRIGEEACREIVAKFSATANTGQLAEGLLTGIAASAAILEKHNPMSG